MTLSLVASNGERLPQIFAFCCGCSRDPILGEMHAVIALDEDGETLASHLSSSHEWARVDIDHKSKHEAYRLKHKNGYALTWVESPKTDARVQAINEKLGRRAVK